MPKPSDDVLRAFNTLFFALMDKQAAIAFQNKTLTQTRDLLLPKLMSGKIRVPINQEIEK